MYLKRITFLTIALLVNIFISNSQNSVKLDKKKYIIGNIELSGNYNLNNNSILNLVNLEIGQTIDIPGEEIQNALKTLWSQGVFSDVQIYKVKEEENVLFLEIYLEQLPVLEKFKFIGIKKSEESSLREDLSLISGMTINENLLINTKNKILDYFIEKGFYNTTCIIREDYDPENNQNTLIIDIQKNNRIKIKKIQFNGISGNIKANKLKRALKNTKEKGLSNILSSSKFIQEKFQEDLINIINLYRENGYRDAKILSDSIFLDKNNEELSVNINIDEGEQYYFGDISWLGNAKFDSEQLNQILSIKNGDLFDQKLLDERLFMSMNGNDISSLYMDDGYLFFQINPVETEIEGQFINLEMRITEGQKAIVNNVSVRGNTKVKDHVIMREVRSLPGSMFKRSDIIRTQEEFNRLGFFNPETLGVNPTPNPETGTVDIEYSVESKSSDQLELQGGWGNGMVVGAFSVIFNNFSTSEFFKPSSWRPIPSGDGKKIRLRAASNGSYYQNYSISFEDPWMGGKKPNSFSISLWKTIQSFNEGSQMNISGIGLGLGKRLKWPDDYFTILHSFNFLRYELQDYQTTLFNFNNGYSNNLNYSTTFSRNSIFNPIYPRSGSQFTLSVELTPPYSLFNDKDYNNIDDQEKYKLLEYNKFKFNGTWYSSIVGDLVFKTHFEFGFLGTYNNEVGLPPFERFFVGGDGLSGYSIDGREVIALRGYPNGSLSEDGGDAIYNKYNLELRYPISLNPSSTIYALLFGEAGNSWANYNNFNALELRKSAGIGLRIFMPMFGLLGIDFAHGFDNIPNSTIKSGWQTHFIIGQQF